MEIGAGRVESAKRYASLFRIFSFTIAVSFATILHFSASEVSHVFTDIEEVRFFHKGIVKNILPIMIVFDTI